MINFLSEDERRNLIIQHKKERDKRICDRIKAVLLFDKGWTYKQIAEALLLDDETIRNHVRDYKSFNKLKPESGGTLEKLSVEQALELVKHLDTHTYLFSKDIVDYVERAFNVHYTVPGMTYWLKQHGFSYKKPAVVPGKASREDQQKWIHKYNKLKNELPADDAICFLDGVHPTHNTMPAYGWIKKGIRREIQTNTGRNRLNISGALDVSNMQVIVREDETLNAESTIKFLNILSEKYPRARKIHIFCDNARYYKNKAVATYLEDSKLKMHFLPPYSPNLNPIERLWKFMYEQVLYNRYYEKFQLFKEAVLGFLSSLTMKKGEIKNMLKKRVRDCFRPIGNNRINEEVFVHT